MTLAIERGLRYLESGIPDLLWCEFPTSDRGPLEDFTGEIRRRFADRFDIDPQAQAVLDGQPVGDEATVHAGQALAYLGLGKLEDVYVEARLSNRLLESEEKLYEKSYQAGGFGHFLSAITYELLGEPDQAYIDYQRMQEKGVGTELAGKALVRLAADLGYQDDLQRWQELYGEAPPPDRDSASIVVLAGVGIGPSK